MKYSKLGGSGGVSWKRYSKETSLLSSNTLNLTFPEITDWSKCAICVSGVSQLADRKPSIDSISINESTNTISIKCSYIKITCDVIQFEGNVKIQRSFIYKFLPKGSTSDSVVIELQPTIKADKSLLLLGETYVFDKYGDYSTYTSVGKKTLSNEKLIFSQSHLDYSINLYITYNVIELLD